ncbi:serine/arginine repetitive matrix protein 1-like [Ananas comosus]|uniref:Serine/arginine repetitive matrix protein 1-like n=1 Tax=Ananas comosus TaxID=4615 RepID=A0A6P5GF61_ANACO|nr:serine/arginine repetitive matrix protein 1-like [Ananas comosus]
MNPHPSTDLLRFPCISPSFPDSTLLSIVGATMEPRALADRDPAQPQRPPPPPPPLQEAAQHCRIRRRRLRGAGSSSSSVSSLSTSSPSSLAVATPPFASPSPYHRFLSPDLRSYSSIPFSWEHRPGIPKNPNRIHPPTLPLPLPPPVLRTPRSKKRPDAAAAAPVAADPFTAALAECARDQSGGDLDRLWGGAEEAARRRWRRAAPIVAAIADRFGVLDLYGSCKAACSVADANVCVPRPGRRRSGSYPLP